MHDRFLKKFIGHLKTEVRVRMMPKKSRNPPGKSFLNRDEISKFSKSYFISGY